MQIAKYRKYSWLSLGVIAIALIVFGLSFKYSWPSYVMLVTESLSLICMAAALYFEIRSISMGNRNERPPDSPPKNEPHQGPFSFF